MEESRYEGRYWETDARGRVVCRLCPRRCALREGQRGFCFVRRNVGGRMILTTYGLSSGFCVDPIEKKPLSHFYPGESVLSFGTAGCNLACRFCQNWSISRAREFQRLGERASPREIAAAARRLGCRAVAFTYNDPVVFAEYAIDTAAACRESGISTVAVTAGYMEAAPRTEFYRFMDAVNVDLKAFSEDFYRRLTLGALQPVLETLLHIHRETSTWLEVTNLLIPGENDADSQIRAMCAWLLDHLGPEVPLHFTAFHPAFRMQDRPPTPVATVRRARRIALDMGLHFVYTGNVVDPEGGITFCPGCRTPLIEREGYRVRGYHLTDDHRCPRCGRPCPGVFGGWGPRRLPVSFDDDVR